MQKYLILNFKNAGLFKVDKKKPTRDYIFDIGGKRERALEKTFVEPITVYQVSNMLHALFGERPKPSLRTTVYNFVPYYFEKAQNSYIKIDNYKILKQDGSEDFISETIHVKKAVFNSWNKKTNLYWAKIEKALSEKEIYDFFIETISGVLKKNVLKQSFYETMKELVPFRQDPRIQNLISYLREKQKNPVAVLFDDIKDSGINATKNKTAVTVNNGVEQIIKLRGTIIVPVNDNDLIKLSSSKGCATLLEGGIVYINKIDSGNRISIEGFTQLKNISTEKI
jgi:hypothetical protein